ncbi:MAG: FkbM family methyltransferase [Carbonactinosporaceae bacterium]
MFRSSAARAVDLSCSLVGRRHVVRAARLALNRARLDLPNGPSINGEYALQGWVLSAIPPGEAVTVLDVGANRGEWSRALLGRARQSGHVGNLALHAFEPASDTYRSLVNSVPTGVRVNRLALSNHAGQATLHVVHPGAGTNSLYDSLTGCGSAGRTEQVETTTLDEYLLRHEIERIDLLKIDTEGHDFAVLLGAERSFKAGAISLAQFEYNHRWVHARHFLKDVFDLLRPLGYQIGKLTPRGMESYLDWDPELESFVENNYLACTEEIARYLPQVRWWKSVAEAPDG